MEREKKTPTFGYALFVTLLAFAVIMIPAVFLGAKTQPLFLISWIVSIPFCMRLGYTYKELQQGLLAYCAKSLVPMTIVLCVGSLIGTWNACGTVPMITKLGLMTINPKYFLVISFFICIVFSLFTGTSFGTCGTAGVALMGVGLSMGLNPLVIAAPIIGGAYFGDAISPLSDSTNCAAGSVGVDLFTSIGYQVFTTAPAALISAAIYLIWGMNIDTSSIDLSSINEVIVGIEANYKLGIVTLLPMLVVLVMLLKRIPSIPSILCGSISGLLVAWLYQGQSLKSVILSMWSGYTLESDNTFIATIFSRGGITSMQGTAFLFIFAFGLFGILSTAGIIDKVVEPLMKRVTGRLSGTICTVILGFIANATSASGNFSFVFTGNLMTPIYERNNLNKWDLTRAMSVGCLLSGLLIPWNSNPLTVTGFLGVEAADMLPYMFTPIITCAVLLFFTSTNIDKKFSKLARETGEQQKNYSN
ncbi:MAG: sodium:proton antiporter [Clostridiales bacterium]|nr:sodium:proton antiporter [Clostridiales bacterium]